MLLMALVLSLVLGIKRQKCCSCCRERMAAGGYTRARDRAIVMRSMTACDVERSLTGGRIGGSLLGRAMQKTELRQSSLKAREVATESPETAQVDDERGAAIQEVGEKCQREGTAPPRREKATK